MHRCIKVERDERTDHPAVCFDAISQVISGVACVGEGEEAEGGQEVEAAPIAAAATATMLEKLEISTTIDDELSSSISSKSEEAKSEVHQSLIVNEAPAAASVAVAPPAAAAAAAGAAPQDDGAK